MTSIYDQQTADEAIARGHAETAARTAATAKAEADRRAGYREQMRQAVAAQGAPSQPGKGEGIRMTLETARHIDQEAAKYERAHILSPAEAMNIETNARHQHMRTHIAAGRPLPNDAELKAIGRAAVEAARDARLGK